MTSIMTSPTGMTEPRMRIAPQRGHVVALAAIMPPHALHEVMRPIPRSPLACLALSLTPGCAPLEVADQIDRVVYLV